MKNKSKTLIFFGNERLLSGIGSNRSPILQSLIDHKYKIVAVVLNKHPTKSRKENIDATANVASRNKIPVYYPSNSNDMISVIRHFKPYAAVLVAYGRLLPSEVIDSFEGGIINIHPSMLPMYRGPSPIETSILNGDKSLGLSLMKLTDEMDAGPIYLQESIEFKTDTDKIQIANEILNTAAEILVKNLDDILSGKLNPIIQDDTKATYCTKLSRDSGRINPAAMTSAEAYNTIRAYKYYPKARIEYNNHQLIINQAHISKIPTGLHFRCVDDNYLIIDELVTPSGKTTDGESYIRGYIRNPK